MPNRAKPASGGQENAISVRGIYIKEKPLTKDLGQSTQILDTKCKVEVLVLERIGMQYKLVVVAGQLVPSKKYLVRSTKCFVPTRQGPSTWYYLRLPSTHHSIPRYLKCLVQSTWYATAGRSYQAAGTFAHMPDLVRDCQYHPRCASSMTVHTAVHEASLLSLT